MKIKFYLTIIFLLNGLLSYAQWQQRGGPYGGLIYSISCDSSKVYAATTGGLYRSDNNGNSWVRKTLAATRIVASQDSLVYIYVADGFNSQLKKSVDYGDNFVQVNSTLPSSNITSLAILGSYVFVGTGNDGLFMSPDSGATWTLSLYTIDASFFKTIIAKNGKIFAGTMHDAIYASIDTGQTWTFSGFGIYNYGSSYAPVNCLGVKDSLIFAGTAMGLHKSTDNGLHWDQMLNGIPAATIYAIASTASAVFASTFNNLYVSFDDGNSWALSDSVISNIGVYDIKSEGQNVFIGTSSAGVFLSNNDGSTWSEMNNGIANVTVCKIEAIQNSLYCVGSNGFYYSNDQGDNWTKSNGGLTVNYFNLMTIAGSELYIGSYGGGVFKSIDFGNNWTYSAFDSTNIYVLYSFNNNVFASKSYGCNLGPHLYESIDNGLTWPLSDSGITTMPFKDMATFGRYIIAGGDCDIYLSADTGRTWTSMYTSDLPDTGNIIRLTSSLFVKDSLIFLATDGGGLYCTSDTGRSWVSKSINMSQLSHTTDMAVAGNILFAGGDQGVYYSMDNGDSWLAANDGIENFYSNTINRPYVKCLTIDSTYIYAGLSNNSILKRSLFDFGITTNADNFIKNSSVSIFPNPAADNLNIVSSSEIQSVEIFNSIGFKIHSEKCFSKTMTINIENLANGFYITQINLKSESLIRKLIVK